ncbi:hypothetical protein SISNIDRAFT_466253 [Sistotremastrum niveocremeum HHB9708]|uniref:Uncharacterized protein n=1 Tax=Sistotremastrum niveocremeum HHB9708 TaxID=1314777 RepID=A0A164UTA3_9AGAM|nr:hypothetical protein SISNIDRAFT_466253 [Sistotremastrum niveocremeum HHB9708]
MATINPFLATKASFVQDVNMQNKLVLKQGPECNQSNSTTTGHTWPKILLDIRVILWDIYQMIFGRPTPAARGNAIEHGNAPGGYEGGFVVEMDTEIEGGAAVDGEVRIEMEMEMEMDVVTDVDDMMDVDVDAMDVDSAEGASVDEDLDGQGWAMDVDVDVEDREARMDED